MERGWSKSTPVSAMAASSRSRSASQRRVARTGRSAPGGAVAVVRVSAWDLS
ncbi:hypothetical protein ACFQZ4_14290 [Catellatospora coxensis]